MPRTRNLHSEDSVPHISLNTPPRRPKKQPLQDITSRFVSPGDLDEDVDDSSSAVVERSPTPTPAAPRSSLRRQAAIAASAPSIRRQPVARRAADPTHTGTIRPRNRGVPSTPTTGAATSTPTRPVGRARGQHGLGRWPHPLRGEDTLIVPGPAGSPLPPSSPPPLSSRYLDSSHPKRSQRSQVPVEEPEPVQDPEAALPLSLASSQLPYATPVERDDDEITPNEEGLEEEYADENIHPEAPTHSTSHINAVATTSNPSHSDPFGFVALEQRLKERKAKNPNLLPSKRDFARGPQSRPIQPRTPHKPKFKWVREESDDVQSSEDFRRKYTNNKYHRSDEGQVEGSSAPSTPSPIKRRNPRPSMAESIVPLTYDEPITPRASDHPEQDAAILSEERQVDNIAAAVLEVTEESSPLPARVAAVGCPDKEDAEDEEQHTAKPASKAKDTTTPAKRATRSSAASTKKAAGVTPAAKKVATRGRKRKAEVIEEEADEKGDEKGDESEEDAMEVEAVVGVRTRSRTTRSSAAPPSKTNDKTATKKARTTATPSPTKKNPRGRPKGTTATAKVTTKKYTSKRATATKAENLHAGKAKVNKEEKAKEKVKGKSSVFTDGMDSEQREAGKWERERQARIEYFKKLDGYAIAKENVYVI
ncbi:hypothetical protein AX16_006227 [Volvariella volvacea WC 439]|nr:hypothetical protein AX16_006227 [Volvariella volvacea WC 439]